MQLMILIMDLVQIVCLLVIIITSLGKIHACCLQCNKVSLWVRHSRNQNSSTSQFCEAVLGEAWRKINLPQIRRQCQNKARTLPKSNLWTWINEFYWGCMQNYGWGVAYGRGNGSKTAVSLNVNPPWVKALKTGNHDLTAQFTGNPTG